MRKELIVNFLRGGDGGKHLILLLFFLKNIYCPVNEKIFPNNELKERKMRKNWFLKAGTLVIALLFIGTMIMVPQVKADEDDGERDADLYSFAYPGGYYNTGLVGAYGGGLYGGGLYGGGLYGGGLYGGGLYGGGLYGGGLYGGGLYGGGLYGGGLYGGGLYGGGLYGGGLYGGGWGSLYSWTNPFGIQNLYYPIDTGTGLNYQVPFVQIAPYLGMASLYNQLFPNLFNSSTGPDNYLP